MIRLKTFLYTCTKCNFQWTDAREKEYADMPVKIGCQKCKSKDINFEELQPEQAKSKAPGIVRGRNLGSIKKDEGFKEVLSKIKSKYPGSTIDV